MNPSRDNILYNFPVDICQSEVTGGRSVGQAFVVEAHEVKDRRVEIVDVCLVFVRPPAKLVGGTNSFLSMR